MDDWKINLKNQCHYHENELCSGPLVRQTKQDHLLLGREYEELHGLWAMHAAFDASYVVWVSVWRYNALLTVPRAIDTFAGNAILLQLETREEIKGRLLTHRKGLDNDEIDTWDDWGASWAITSFNPSIRPTKEIQVVNNTCVQIWQSRCQEKKSDLPSRCTTVVREVFPPPRSKINSMRCGEPTFETRIAHMLGRQVATWVSTTLVTFSSRGRKWNNTFMLTSIPEHP